MAATPRATGPLILSVWAALLTGLTVCCGTAPLLGLRRGLGRPLYWVLLAGLVGASWAAKIPTLAFGFVVAGLVAGVLVETDLPGVSLFYRSVVTVMISLGLLLALYLPIQKTLGLKVTEAAQASVKTLMVRLDPEMDAGERKTIISNILIQLPSAGVMLVMASVFFGLLYERRLQPQKAARPKLSSFGLPDYFVWFFLAALFGTFYDHGNENFHRVALNCFNVAVFVYFFQGLAVVIRFFEVFRVGAFWRIFWTAVLVVQLFFMVSLIGLLDLWLEFRPRLERRAAQIDKSI